jgi:hypothetical protein
MSDPAVLTAIIAASVALTVGVLAQAVAILNQFLAHRLSQRREVEKYYNEVYQKLFAPIVSDAFLYIDMVSNYRRRHDTSLEQEIEVKDRVIGFFKDKLILTSPSLLSSYHDISQYRIADDRGANPSPAELKFMHDLLMEYARSIKNTSLFNDKSLSRHLSPVYRRAILYLLLSFEEFNRIVGYSWQFDRTEYTENTYKSIEKTINDHKKSGEDRYQKQLKIYDKYLMSYEEPQTKEQQKQQEFVLNKITELRNGDKKFHQESRDNAIKDIIGILINRRETRAEAIRSLFELYHSEDAGDDKTIMLEMDPTAQLPGTTEPEG